MAQAQDAGANAASGYGGTPPMAAATGTASPSDTVTLQGTFQLLTLSALPCNKHPEWCMTVIEAPRSPQKPLECSAEVLWGVCCRRGWGR